MIITTILYIFVAIFLVLILYLIMKKNNKVEIQLDSPLNWTDIEELEIVNIEDESHDVKSFYLKRTNGKKIPHFKAGQFLSFQIGNNKKIYRSYSLSSTAEESESCRISIKLLPTGTGSNWFFKLKVGDKVFAHPPSGHFTDVDFEKSIHRVFIAGGIGVTPFIPMIMNACKNNIKVDLFYGMRSENDLVFHKELLKLSESNSSFSYHPILSRSNGQWSGDKGHISVDFIQKFFKIDDQKKYLLCGPDGLTKTIIDSLTSLNVAKSNILIEEFFINIPKSSNKNIECNIKYNGDNYKYKGTDTILDFLDEEDADVLYSCRNGVCGVCKCKLISGEVESLSSSGLTDEEKENGFILTCVSKPKSDIVIKEVN